MELEDKKNGMCNETEVWISWAHAIIFGEQLVYKSFGQILELFDSSVAQERPPAADVFASAHIDFNHQVFFFEIAGLSEKFTLRTGYKAVAPELNATAL